MYVSRGVSYGCGETVVIPLDFESWRTQELKGEMATAEIGLVGAGVAVFLSTSWHGIVIEAVLDHFKLSKNIL